MLVQAFVFALALDSCSGFLPVLTLRQQGCLLASHAAALSDPTIAESSWLSNHATTAELPFATESLDQQEESSDELMVSRADLDALEAAFAASETETPDPTQPNDYSTAVSSLQGLSRDPTKDNTMTTTSKADLDALEEVYAASKSEEPARRLSSKHKVTTGRARKEGGREPEPSTNEPELGTDSIGAYIRTMCNHEVLNKNEEVVLGREIQLLLQWEKKRDELEVELLRQPTYAEWAASIRPGMTVQELKKQIRRSLRAKSALIESNIRLVIYVAKRYQWRGLSFQDLAQEGIMGLTRACEKYDPEKGFRFSTYATWWIKQGIMRGICDQGRAVRLPAYINDQLTLMRKKERELRHEFGRDPTTGELALRMNLTEDKIEGLRRVLKAPVSMEQILTSSKVKGSAAGGGGDGSGLRLEETLSLPDDQTPIDGESYQMFRDDLSRLICTLSAREQAVIRMRFGLDDGHGKTLGEIGRRFSVSRERVRQIEGLALSKLRQPFRNYAMRSYVRDFL